MSSASSPITGAAQDDDLGRAFAHVRRETRKLHEQARRTNRAMAQFEDELAKRGIKLTIQENHK